MAIEIRWGAPHSKLDLAARSAVVVVAVGHVGQVGERQAGF